MERQYKDGFHLLFDVDDKMAYEMMLTEARSDWQP
jgi:hypothetical protein